MMSLHKLTAGDGYLYLIRQVAAADATDRGRPSLADYYSSKGETPGVWTGRGLAALGAPASRDPADPLVAQLWSVPAGSQVSEDQMKALFGEGLHPNADRITAHLTGFGVAAAGVLAAARLGRPFRVNSGENEFTRRLRGAYGDYNAAAGRERSTGLDPDTRARIRTRVAEAMFAETHARPPADERELSGFIARHSRAPTTAVAGYDLTFTPVKSVSALWAIAPRPIAHTIEDCHHQAVAEAIAFLEDHAAFSRMGANGIAQVNTTGLIAAAFDHRDSRAGDPNLHTHVAVSNKVQAIGADGIPRWLALDGTPLHKAAVAASELYNTRLEAHLIASIGVRFAAADTTKAGKRPVREIAGVPAELIQLWSSRRSAIEHRVGQLTKQFHTEHGREPTAVEMLAISQQATLETRHAKHEPRSLAEQRHTWRTEAVEILGSRRRLTQLIADITGHTGPQHRKVTDTWVHEQAARIIATVAEARATWQINNVRAEAQRLLRYSDHPAGPALLDRVVAAALTEHSIAISGTVDTDLGEPAPLRRRDGASIYTGHDSAVYTSAAVMAAERRILAAAGMRGGHVVDEASIGLALLYQHARHGVPLNDDQAALVQQMASSGARVQLALAAAGTGKTTAMAALARAWNNSGGNVIGLAPTACAAEVLAGSLEAPTDTIAKFIQLADPSSAPPAHPDDPARRWFDTVGPATLLIVDEAAMASTRDLDILVTHALTRRASVRLIGDDQQLNSISAGGALRDIADREHTPSLTAVVRFTDEQLGAAEAAASLAIRAGDPAGIGFYIDHHRVHVGADAVAAEMAYLAWAADRAAGRDAILIAPTNELAAQLNERARLDRLRRDPTPAGAATVTLSDGLTASAGDVITTRRNARWLRVTRGTWVRNGHRWIVGNVGADGSLTVAPVGSDGRAHTVRLPAGYVAAHTTLGYAGTIDTAQGVTADTCHVVGSDRLTRQQLYVAITRGRNQNHLYFSTAEADPHRILAPKATHPPTAVDILSTILGRDGAQVSAHRAAAAHTDPAARLPRAADMYADALTAAAEQHAGTAIMARIDAAARALGADISDAAAWPVLRRNLALFAIDGHNPLDALHDAAAQGPLDDARDPAAVLDWRLQPPPGSAAARVGPLRWLPAIPEVLHRHPHWGPYLAARARLVTELAEQVRAAARGWDSATAPAWARPLLAKQPELTAEIAVFRAAHDVDPADTRISGPPQHANRSAAVQHLITTRLDATIGRAEAGAKRWRTLAERIDPHITADPFWPRLAGHLDEAARAGADVAALLTQALTRHGPLPDELPAAALWWRLAGTLAPPTLEAVNTRLRPAWTGLLHHLLGSRIAETVLADPAWPSLVAAVAASDWPPGDLLAAAAEHLLDVLAAEQVRPDEYARMLTYRVELLTHQAASIDPDIPHPADTTRPPTAAHQLDLFTDGPDAENTHLQERPPDPLDYPYGWADHTLGDLDFADLPAHRPTGIQPGTDVDIAALRARRDNARRHAHDLARAILSGGTGPAEHAAAAELAQLGNRHHQQRHHQHNLAHAHADWISAEHTAEVHHRLLGRLTARITAARDRGDTQLAQLYTSRRDQLAGHTADIDATVTRARQRRDTAHAALLDVAGGAEGVVTERDIAARRAQALRADTRALRAARAAAAALDNQLARAEAVTARAFAAGRTGQDSRAAELPTLRDEVELLGVAGARSPAAVYTAHDEALRGLDAPSRRAVTALVTSAQAIQPLRLHLDADKPDVLAAIAATAHHNHARILAVPGTAEAADYAAEHRYADTTATPAVARERLDSGRWKLPTGSLVIVDDADQLAPDVLRFFIDQADRTNTKLLILTTPGRQPAHTLIAVLATNLPWAQQLGSPDRSRQQPATALERAERHLAATSGVSPARTEAAQLLQRRDALIRHYDYLADNAIPSPARSPDRRRTHGLEL